MENFATWLSIFASILSIVAVGVSVRAWIVAKNYIKGRGDSNQVSMRVSASTSGKNDK